MHNIEIETTKPSLNLLNLLIAVKQSKAITRDRIAAIVAQHNYNVHVGGHHVAVMDGGTRLALITSDVADFQ